MSKISKPDYLAKAKKLTKVETERLLSRMGGKLDRRMEKGKVSPLEALAKQLELEDEKLFEWRKVMLSLKKKEETKEANKEGKKGAKTKSPAKAKVPAKTKAPVRAKPTSKN